MIRPFAVLNSPVLVLILLAPACARHPAPATAPATAPPPAPAAAPASPRAAPAAAAAAPDRGDTDERLQALLWVQTSAEFHLLAGTIYQRAAETFDRAAKDPGWTASTEQQELGSFANLPIGVIMDIDETVLDNVRSAGQMLLDREPFTLRGWTEWTALAEASPIPGAREFIAHVRAAGGHVVFITNRTAAEEAATVRNLTEVLKIPVAADDVLSSGENGWTSDKSPRRREAARRYRIALLVGDDLNDFVSVGNAKTPEDRLALAETRRDWWRDRWVLLPNPVYGSWERVLTAGVTGDAATLARKRATVKGYKEQ